MEWMDAREGAWGKRFSGDVAVRWIRLKWNILSFPENWDQKWSFISLADPADGEGYKWCKKRFYRRDMRRRGWRVATRRGPTLPWRLLSFLLILFIVVILQTTRWYQFHHHPAPRNIKKSSPQESSIDAAVESLFPYLRLEQTGEEKIARLARSKVVGINPNEQHPKW